MAFFLPRKLLATAVLAALSLPGWAQSEAAVPAPAAATPPAVSAPAAQAATPAARPGPRAQRGGPRYHQQQRYRHHRMRAEQRAAYWQEHRAQHLAQLKGQLQLSPAQEASWTEFTTAMEHQPRHARLGWDDAAQLTTPERIDRMRALRAQRAAEADRRGDAVKAFYAQLNPAQQKTFDAHHGAYRAQHYRMMGGPGGRALAPAPGGEGAAQPGWQHPDCPMDGSGPRDGRGPRGPRGAAPAQ